MIELLALKGGTTRFGFVTWNGLVSPLGRTPPYMCIVYNRAQNSSDKIKKTESEMSIFLTFTVVFSS